MDFRKCKFITLTCLEYYLAQLKSIFCIDIMQWPKIIYLSVMGLALLASLRGYRDRKYVLFIPLLALSLAVELVRHYLSLLYPSITPPLSLFVAVEYTLLSLIIANFIESEKQRMLIRASIF